MALFLYTEHNPKEKHAVSQFLNPEVKSNAQKRIIFDLITHAVFTNQLKNCIFYCYQGHWRCHLKITWPWERGWKSNIFGLQIGSFRGHSFHDRSHAVGELTVQFRMNFKLSPSYGLLYVILNIPSRSSMILKSIERIYK